MQLNGSEIVIECLKEQGVDTVFGYPGGAILNIYDALYKHPEIRHILTSHEQGASHAADGYARASGKVGVCFATSGPGATNLVTGIATAHMDSVPLVAITCNVGLSLLGRDSFQEVDIAGVTMPVTKYSVIVKDIRDLAPTIRRAFRIAKSGRPGPVLVDITKDVTAALMEFEPMKPAPIGPKTDTIRKEDIAAALAMIEEAEKPMILVGGGAVISEAKDTVREFIRRVDAPVSDTLMGKGVFDGHDADYMGMLGMHGTKAANLSVTRCDLLIALGTRFSDRDTGHTPTFASQAKILQFDVDACEINKNVRVDQSVIGDLNESLKLLLSVMKQQEHREWKAEVNDLKEKFPLFYDKDRLTGPYVIETIHRLSEKNTIITTDVGQHQMWAAQYYRYSEPRTLLTSGGLGTMGYGLGAAIGAKVARPDQTVINITGDGCFRMNMNELVTAVRNNLHIIEVVMDNSVLGMVYQWQNLFYEKRYSSTVFNDSLDYVKLGEAMGAKAFRVERAEDLEAVLKEALACEGPVLIDCRLCREDMVFPMVPAGKPNETVFDQRDMQE
ncbi:MAG: biosynthetic-type acetolactate synthase large subunit [Lachnospiraceae bacterium]|nr:biosynthetic-type acetolactate synthase large subunit [Lachnospiraceae bacterium]